MRKAKISLLKFLYALVIGLFVSAFSFGASTVIAAEPQANEAVADEAAPAGENADDGSSGMFLLLGGMLLIIIAVVVTVSASVVSVAAVADEV